MPTKSFKIDSTAKRTVLIVVAAVCVAGAFFFAKWGFGNTIASRAEFVEVAELAAELAPDDPQTHYTAAVFYERTFSSADLERSLAEYETAAGLAPHNYLYWLELGMARERSGDREGAERALRYALRHAPNYSRVHWALGNVLLRQGRTGEAFAAIRRAVSDDPLYTNAAAQTAWQIFDGDLGQLRAAIGDSTRLNAALATLLASDKRFEEAVGVWQSLDKQERSSSATETGEVLLRQLLDAKKFRLAFNIASENADSVGQIVNGGFEGEVKMKEAGAFEWQIADGVSPQVAFSDTQKHGGSRSLVIAFGANNKDFRQISQTVAVEPGNSYEMELFYRADLKTAAKFKWEAVSVTDGTVLGATDAILNSADWSPAKVKFRMPGNSDGVGLRLARENCSPPACAVSGNVWFDDFSLKML